MLSHLLNHAHICRADSPIILANEYLHELRVINQSLQRYLAESTSDGVLLFTDLRDIDVILMGYDTFESDVLHMHVLLYHKLLCFKLSLQYRSIFSTL